MGSRFASRPFRQRRCLVPDRGGDRTGVEAGGFPYGHHRHAPMVQMADARVLGRFADGVILVVRSAQTTREMAAAAAQRLAEDGTRVLGTILNRWDPLKTNQYAYG